MKLREDGDRDGVETGATAVQLARANAPRAVSAGSSADLQPGKDDWSKLQMTSERFRLTSMARLRIRCCAILAAADTLAFQAKPRCNGA